MANPVEPVTGQGAFAVSPDDAAVFARRAAALYVGGEGDVTLKPANGPAVTFTGVKAGAILPVSCTQVLATGTTATAIVAITY
jgi:hypothetical protein